MSKELVSENMVAIDIDQTLAGGVVKAHLLTYNQELDLDMTPDQIEESGLKYPKTFDVPAIKEYRSRSDVAEARFQEVRVSIRTSPEVHLNFSPLPFTAEGVKYLTTDPNVELKGYYTVRPIEVKKVTSQWLHQNQLPSSEKVTICYSHEDKLGKVISDCFLSGDGERNSIPPRKAVIIDDSIRQLVEAAYSLVKKEEILRSLMKQIIIVGFGVDEANKNKLLEGVIYPELGLQTLSLPSWERLNVERLVHDLRT